MAILSEYQEENQEQTIKAIDNEQENSSLSSNSSPKEEGNSSSALNEEEEKKKLKPNKSNGLDMDNYSWGQSLQEVAINVPVPPGNRVVKHSKKIKKMDVDGAMEIHLQEEMIMDILSRLCVKSLLRFKCVSKFWMTLISESYFTRKHLNLSKDNQNSQKLLVVHEDLRRDTRSCILYCSSLSSSVQLNEEVQMRHWPSNGEPWSCILLCCFDGLFLIKISDCPDEDLILMLWNPSTRESIVLPLPEYYTQPQFSLWGLGYDSTSDDYKILKINDRRGSQLLTLKSGSWRSVAKQHVHPVIDCMDSLAFVHGAFHWVGKLPRYSMISFSISNEVYGEIPLPEQTCCGYLTWGVSVLGEMLCAYLHNESHTEDIFKFWVMKDYGVKESWTELFEIQGTSLYYVKPKYRFSNGEVLLCYRRWKQNSSIFTTSKQVLFGLWPPPRTFQRGFVYTESLIFPKLIS